MAANQQQEFKLSEDLEALVLSCHNSTKVKERIESDPDDMDVRAAAVNFYGPLRAAGLSSVDHARLRVSIPQEAQWTALGGEIEMYHTLNSRLQETDVYQRARDAWLGKLDDDHKLDFYVGLVGEGIIPEGPDGDSEDAKNAFNKLKEAVVNLQIAKKLESYIRRGKFELAEELVRESMGTGTKLLLEVYKGAGSVSSQKAIYEHITEVRRNMAATIIKEKNLYGLIDKGIDRNPAGKAHALTGLYFEYQAQRSANERAERAA